jgi:rare lipoprotein A
MAALSREPAHARPLHPGLTPARRSSPLLPLVLLLGLAACAVTPPSSRPFFSQEGTASWYGGSHRGHLTADGERFNPSAFTAAHRRLAFGTVVRVTNLENGRMVKVRVNDRGPYANGRIIDLSAAAGEALGMREDGVVPVRLEVYAADQPRR